MCVVRGNRLFTFFNLGFLLENCWNYSMLHFRSPVDNFGTVIGENPDCLLLSGTVVGENPDHVYWEANRPVNKHFELVSLRFRG